MRYIKPGAIEGSIDAPGSKSVMQRAVIAAALAEGESLITNPTFCDDAVATMNVVQALGAQITRTPEGVIVHGGGKPKGATLDCGESGTCMRMISAVAALYGKEFMITGNGTLMKRPVGMIEEPLRMLGAKCSTDSGLPPIRIKGPMHGGKVSVDGSVSSQFLSGLLMALPLCKEDSDVEVFNLKSKAYVSLTQSLMSRFGVRIRPDSGLERFLINGGQRYKARSYSVDGDWSGAAFILVAGAVSGSVTVERLANGLQPDLGIMDALEKAGAKTVQGDESVKVHGGNLKAFEFDATDCPDLFPPLAVLACNCKGKSVIHGASRLKHKESDRASVLAQELGKLGADIKVIGDRMEIIGKKLAGGRINPHGDHRIAMAGAIAALNSEKGVEIEGEGCVSKSYPGFFEDLESLMEK
ncbi:3-phosphoshikimate 1-carboxyvinyltransferase [Candidatus Micrarchaeota archaeon]|nr:3-phosphoshikimate 1-carboxyvinyltransferase [Candidatus Micrarchaeota archaeon]